MFLLVLLLVLLAPLPCVCTTVAAISLCHRYDPLMVMMVVVVGVVVVFMLQSMEGKRLCL